MHEFKSTDKTLCFFVFEICIVSINLIDLNPNSVDSHQLKKKYLLMILLIAKHFKLEELFLIKYNYFVSFYFSTFNTQSIVILHNINYHLLNKMCFLDPNIESIHMKLRKIRQRVHILVARFKVCLKQTDIWTKQTNGQTRCVRVTLSPRDSHDQCDLDPWPNDLALW